jgi:hypothetical protein
VRQGCSSKSLDSRPFCGAVPALGVNAQSLNTGQEREVYECPVIRDLPVAKQPREQSERTIAQCWIDERLRPLEGFCRTAAREAICVKASLDDFGKKLWNGTPPELVPAVPSIQPTPGEYGRGKRKLLATRKFVTGRPVRSMRGAARPLCLSAIACLRPAMKRTRYARRARMSTSLRQFLSSGARSAIQ